MTKMFRFLTFILIVAVTSYHAFHAASETQSPNVTEKEPNFPKDASIDSKIAEGLTPIIIGNKNYYKSRQVDETLYELQAEIKKHKDIILFLKQRDVTSENVTEPCVTPNRTFTFKSGLTDVSKINLQLHKKVLELSDEINTLKRNNEEHITSQLDWNKQRKDLVAENKELRDDILSETKIISMTLQQELESKAEKHQSILTKVAAVEAKVKEMTKLQSAEFSKLQNSTKHIMSDLKLQICPHQKPAAAAVKLTRIGGRDYLIHKTSSKTWSDARQFCKSIGMGLLSVETSQEHHMLHHYFLQNSRAGHYYWTSGSDEDEEGTWVWTETDVKYTLINKVIADGGTSQNCMCTGISGPGLSFFDHPCSSTKYFICETYET